MDGCSVRSITDSLKSNMTHSQESRVSSTQDNYRLSEESRSSVSALVSRLNSSAHGVDATENKKLRGDLAKTKEKNMQDPFPWMRGYFNLCQAFVGTRNAKHLENLMNIYLKNVTPNVEDCYRKPNRAAKLKKSMNTTLIFFHLLYQEVKEALEHSLYLDKMTTLVSMYLDMELKASIRSTESSKKVASRLTSSLYIFLDNSEEHMLDAILMTKYIHKNYREICQPLLVKLINNISMYPIYDKLYVRYLLIFKLWKKIIPDPDEKKRINRTAVQKLHEPPNLMKNIKGMGNVLPRIPKTKKEITLFLMQSNFSLKNACKEFLKYVKTSQKAAYSQVLAGVEIDKPLFFMNHSGDTSPRLSEKEDESDSGSSNNLMNDIWSAISTVESNVTKRKRSKEVSGDKATAVASPEVPVKNKKMKKKVNKGKKKMVVLSELKNKKKKKCLKKSVLNGILKEGKKLSKLKKKKKKLLQSDECSQVNMKQPMPQNGECNQIKCKVAVSQTEECLTVTVKPASPPAIEECDQVQSKPVLPLVQESDQGNCKVETPPIEECSTFKVEKSSPQVEEPKEDMHIEELPETVASEQNNTNQTSLQTEEYDRVKFDITCNQMNSRQVFVQITDSDQVLKSEAKVQQIDFPKSEKFEVSPSITQQNSETEISDKVEKVKTEFIMNINDIEMNSDAEVMKQENTINYVSCGTVSDIAEYKKPNTIPKGSEYYLVPVSCITDHKNKVENIYVQRSDIFTVEKPVENMDVSVSSVCEEEKVVDYCQKSKNSDLLTPVLDSSDDMDICTPSAKQVVCDQNVGDANKADPYVENLAETKPRETKEDTHMSDDSDLISRPFASKNGEEFMEYFYSEKCQMNRNDRMELDSEYPIYGVDDWIHCNGNNCLSPDRLILPASFMEEDDDDIVEIQEGNLSNSFESTPRRGGLGKISFAERKEEEIKDRNAAHAYLMHNSSDSGSATTDTSMVTPSASGSSSPRSEGAMESVEIQETIEPYDNMMKGSEPDLIVQNPDKSYNSSSSPKRSYTVSSEKERSIAQTNYYADVNDCLNRKPSVVLPNMDNHKSFNKDVVRHPTHETPTASRKNCAETLRTEKKVLQRGILPSRRELWRYNCDKCNVDDKIGVDDIFNVPRLDTYTVEKEENASIHKNASRAYLPLNSSDSGSPTTDTFVVTPSASGSSSPRSESAMESVEIQETIEPCDNMKGPEPDLIVQIPDKLYNSSSSPKSSYTVSSEKERSIAQTNYYADVSDCLNRKASVVLPNVDNHKFFKKDPVRHSTHETPTASRKNCAETLRTKTSNQIVKGGKIDTQNASGKQRDGKYFMNQTKAVRGQRRRGRPPCRGKAVSSTSKVSSDSKSIRKQGNSGKGRTDPEYQVTQSKKSVQNYRPMTRSLFKGLGVVDLLDQL